MTNRPFRQIRGTNLLPMVGTSHNLSLAWIPIREPAGNFPVPGVDGLFWRAHADAEIAEMASRGVNSVRLWGSYLSWYINPASYMAILTYYAQALQARGMGMQFILWNAVPAGSAASSGTGAYGIITDGTVNYDPNLAKILLWTLSATWQIAAPPFPAGGYQLSHWAEPFSGTEWDSIGFLAEGDAFAVRGQVYSYVRAIARFFSQGVGLAVNDGVDLYNEANIFSASATRWSYVKNFIGQCATIFRQIAPATRLGIGMAGIPQGRTAEVIATTGTVLDFLSVHCYDHANVVNYFLAALNEANICRIPTSSIILSEGYKWPDNIANMSAFTSFMSSASVGGYFWSILRNNVYDSTGPVDGVLRCSQVAQSIRTVDVPAWTPTQAADLAAFNTWATT